MVRDAQGHDLSGATAEAVADLDRAVRAFTLVFGDTADLYDKARAAAPRFAMAYLGKAWPLTLANDAMLAGQARALLDAALALPMNERERAHAAALTHAVAGHRAAAVVVLDRHLMSYPRDLVAHMAALQMDGHIGRFHHGRDRSLRALPHWSPSQESYGILQSFYAFGLEEAGDYARAEDTGRAAAEREPNGYRPHHCVSHVMEMTGRPRDGLTWMAEREPLWSTPASANRVHIWWHKALFHLELGENDAALALYDGPILATLRPASMSLCNGSALLWRLDTLAPVTRERWADMARRWSGHADGSLAPFTDIHAAMAEIGAGEEEALGRRVAAMRRTAAGDGELAPLYREIGLPIVDALAAFHRGDNRRAVDLLLPLRLELWRMGGSHAQRDVIEWTLIEAAGRAGMRDIALSLAFERLASRPGGVPSRRFKAQAEAIPG